jgi:hypothetical protein
MMVDVQAKIVTLLETAGLDVWRNRLPAGFENDTPTVVLTTQDDDRHLSGSTRRVLCECRIYGGSASVSDLLTAYEDVVTALTMRTTSELAITGELRGQELPPEPDTGWLGYILRFEVRVKER